MFLFRLRNRHFFLLDIVLLAVTPVLALALRLDLSIPEAYQPVVLLFITLALIVKIPIFMAFGLYNRYWRYASMEELLNIVGATVIAGALVAALFYTALTAGVLREAAAGFPRSVPLLDAGLTLLAVGGLRFVVRAAEHRRARRQHGRSAPGCSPWDRSIEAPEFALDKVINCRRSALSTAQALARCLATAGLG